jgi:hypothetical protein
MAECIYCGMQAEAPQFSRPEHVVPRAFGRFRANLTIFCVCEACNQWFGDHLEVSFARNSGEAIMRLLSGVKPSREASEIGGSRLDITAGETALFEGAQTHFIPHANGHTVIASYIPQVGFAEFVGAEPILFLESELSQEVIKKFASYEVLIIGETEADYERLSQKLQELGCQAESVLWCRPDTSLPLVREPVNVSYRLDEVVFRTIAKIAFDYLAYAAGPALCLSPDFDSHRRFARYGEGDWREFVALSQAPILFDEVRTGTRQTRGHILIVEWHERSAAPFASVKLFNDIHYRIRLARTTTLLWREIRSGHHFNIKNGNIDQISIVNSKLV